MTEQSRCPFSGAPRGTTNRDWWPERLELAPLRQHSEKSDPMGQEFDYAAAFTALDIEEVKQDIAAVMTESQSWWPADYGHYGPLFIRLAWHSAGTYRVGDGRGGSGSGFIRFAPQNSWPDNANLDKARRLLWPVKKKYGRSISWADLMILAGNVALESMGFATFGFAGGRDDVWEADETYWGAETEWLADHRNTDGELENPLGAVQMGLIYVNPEGPGGDPDPIAAARAIRETFARMAMNDEETVALIAGGHTFGKAHGAANPGGHVGREPEGAPIEQQGLGWQNSHRSGRGADTITSGLEGAWTTNPTRWDNEFFENLFAYDWELTTSPAGAKQWRPVGGAGDDTVIDAHDSELRHAPMMLTTDLALRFDPAYEQISRRFLERPDEFAKAFARAWFKLTHRDLGPYERGLGSLVPHTAEIWQDPVPSAPLPLVGAEQISDLKKRVIESGLGVEQLVATAWASAATFRGTDRRGGANGARVRLEPQRSWEVNQPAELDHALSRLEEIRDAFEAANPGYSVTMADMIVLAGSAGVEEASRRAGVEVSVPFTPGRGDALAAHTDVESIAVLEPTFDGFRNYVRNGNRQPVERLLVERAQLLTLTPPEMTVLLGGLRVIGVSRDGLGVLTDSPGRLSTDFFVNLLDMGTEWSSTDGQVFAGTDRESGAVRWMATRADLIFGSHSELRALAEVYACDDAGELFVRDFVRAWVKVMELDRFDLHR